MRFHYFLIVLLAFGLAAAKAPEKPTYIAINQVIDGDTAVLADGRTVRFLDINTPELAKDPLPAEPLAEDARTFTHKLLKGKNVRLEMGRKKTDRYGRTLAHLYLPDGTWVNGEIIKNGFGHIYTFSDNTQKFSELAPLEEHARKTQKGLWALPQFQVFAAADISSLEPFIGRFTLTQGVVRHAVRVKDRIYLNFGDNWRTDFSVEIRERDWKFFKRADVDPLTFYMGKKVIVRGVLKPVNGILVTATHPEEISVD